MKNNIYNDIILKPSMFNYKMYSDDNMMIYNSYKGMHSILYVCKESRDKVEELLTATNVIYNSEDPVLVKLYKSGYLVPIDCDEKSIREKVRIDMVSEGTLNLVIHTTDACNFRCRYCYMDFGHTIMPVDVQDKIISFVAKNLIICTGVSISWFGGEPLLGLDVISNMSRQIISICKKAKKPYHASITTNGYLLTPEVFQKLLDCKVTTYTITIDGLKDLHDQYRTLRGGEGSFDRIIQNLIHIRDFNKSCALRVYIRTNVTCKFINCIDQYIEYYQALFGRDKRFGFFIRPVDNWGGERVNSIATELISYDVVGEIYRRISQVRHSLNFLPALSALNKGGATCSAHCKNKYTIGVNGLISKCDEADSGDGNLAIGNIFENLNIIDENLHSKWLYSGSLNKTDCEDCFYSIPCLMGCCSKYTVLSGERACPLNYKELNGLIMLAGAVLESEYI